MTIELPLVPTLVVAALALGLAWRPFWRRVRFWSWQHTTYAPMGHEPPPGYYEWYYPDGHRR